MGEARRRKQLLGNAYGVPDTNAQIKNAQIYINAAINHARDNHARDKEPLYLIIQCTNQDQGYSFDVINAMKDKLLFWETELKIPTLIQMLPKGFEPSASQCFDGFITVWCNDPNHRIWQELFTAKLNT